MSWKIEVLSTMHRLIDSHMNAFLNGFRCAVSLGFTALAAVLFLFTSVGVEAQTPYYLTVESAPAVGAGGTVYRFYVNANDPTDKLSAVYGTDVDNLVLNTPANIFNSAFNSSLPPNLMQPNRASRHPSASSQ